MLFQDSWNWFAATKALAAGTKLIGIRSEPRQLANGVRRLSARRRPNQGKPFTGGFTWLSGLNCTTD